MTGSKTHIVLIPSYNSGPKLAETIRSARAHWAPVWVVIDGSTDGSDLDAVQLAEHDPDLRVIVLPRNGGKGSAMLAGLRAARAVGFSHVLAMDADGQHPAEKIPEFMRVSAANPGAMILGRPLFDESAPKIRVYARKLANWFANIETLGAGIGDCLFGFRVYPLADLLAVMEETRWMRGFDFDAEAAVRLIWRGAPVINLPAEVRYFSRAQGGISHFHYGRDNVLLVWMNLRLLAAFGVRLPALLIARIRWRNAAGRTARPA